MSDTRIPMPILTAMHPGNPHGLRFAEGDGGDPGTGQGGDGTDGDDGKGQEQPKTFTQSDMDELAKKVRGEERRKASERYADYDDLKAKAEGAKTDADRIKDLEGRYAAAEARALRADVANRHGITPEDRDLFLTGTDEETLTAQAKRLAERESERKKNGNHVPGEGTNPPPADDKDAQARAFFGIT